MKLLLCVLLLVLAVPAAAQTVERAYGTDPRQRLDFTPADTGNAPLVLFIHGGAWSFGDKRAAAHMASFFHGQGLAFAAINYRLAPDFTVEQQAEDVATAVASLLRDAGPLRLDRRVFLIGHSAGAHLAALVGTDPRYFEAHGVPLGSISGIVLLDGAGYDVPRQIDAAGPLLRRMYLRAFGADPDRQRGLSPIAHAAAPNVRNFSIIHSSRRVDATAQAAALAKALNRGGSIATVHAVDDSHAGIFRNFGQPGHEATAYAGAFVVLVLGFSDLQLE